MRQISLFFGEGLSRQNYRLVAYLRYSGRPKAPLCDVRDEVQARVSGELLISAEPYVVESSCPVGREGSLVVA